LQKNLAKVRKNGLRMGGRRAFLEGRKIPGKQDYHGRFRGKINDTKMPVFYL